MFTSLLKNDILHLLDVSSVFTGLAVGCPFVDLGDIISYTAGLFEVVTCSQQCLKVRVILEETNRNFQWPSEQNQ